MGGKVSLRCKGKTSFALLNTVSGKVGLNMMTFTVLQNKYKSYFCNQAFWGNEGFQNKS